MNKVTKIIYAIHPGEIISRYDGDLHFITAKQLMRLYRVKPENCIVWDIQKARCWDSEKYYHLFPDHLGIYELPKKKGIDDK